MDERAADQARKDKPAATKAKADAAHKEHIAKAKATSQATQAKNKAKRWENRTYYFMKLN